MNDTVHPAFRAALDAICPPRDLAEQHQDALASLEYLRTAVRFSRVSGAPLDLAKCESTLDAAIKRVRTE